MNDDAHVQPIIARSTLFFLLASLGAAAGSLYADTYHVRIDGVDAEERDGRSPEAAWKSLAYACQQVPEGEHEVRLGPGEFVADRRAQPKSGMTIAGSGAEGEGATRIVASSQFLRPETLRDDADGKEQDEYLIAVRKAENLTLRDLELASPADRHIRGGFYARDVDGLKLENVRFQNFRWNGARIEFCKNVDVGRCVFLDASTERAGKTTGGLIRTRWIENARFHHNRIVATETEGYGYKGGGHVGMRFDHNFVDVGYFAFESAHENEFGIEIDRNHLTRCISIPKGGPGADPNDRGFPYAVWIHDNLLTDSYTVEGPRNHLWLTHNYIRVEKPGGRIYTQHGGKTHGPIVVAQNVVENVDRSFFYMNEGLCENAWIVNNTVFCADAGDRAGSILSSWSGERMNGWIVKNNVFVAPEAQPRQFFPTQRGVPEKIDASHNLLVNVTGATAKDFQGKSPGFEARGDKPAPWFRPASDDSFVVGRGVDVGWPGSGEKPNLGAYELPEIDSQEPRPFPGQLK